MFTGLIAACGHWQQYQKNGKNGDGGRLTIEIPLEYKILPGDSLAVNGACLTVEELSKSEVRLHVSAETENRTRLGRMKKGTLLNLERALKVGDRLGGHFVSGHVDCLGEVASVPSGRAGEWKFKFPKEFGKYVVAKGSVAVDGISLTPFAVGTEHFSTAIIPETVKRTNLAELKIGDAVHIEWDILAKYLEKLTNKSIAQDLDQGRPAITREFLAKQGF